MTRPKEVPGGTVFPAGLDRLPADLAIRPVSLLSEHDSPCCRQAIGWFRAMVHASALRSPDPWPVAQRWPWGPTTWPLTWCEAVRATELDCGALAHLAATAFEETGHRVFRVQLIERCDPELAVHWAIRWKAAGAIQPWIWRNLAYHEAVGVMGGMGMRVWDPTSSRWHGDGVSSGSGQIVALRVAAPADLAAESWPRAIHWGARNLPIGAWVVLR